MITSLALAEQTPEEEMLGGIEGRVSVAGSLLLAGPRVVRTPPLDGKKVRILVRPGPSYADTAIAIGRWRGHSRIR